MWHPLRQSWRIFYVHIRRELALLVADKWIADCQPDHLLAVLHVFVVEHLTPGGFGAGNCPRS